MISHDLLNLKTAFAADELWSLFGILFGLAGGMDFLVIFNDLEGSQGSQ